MARNVARSTLLTTFVAVGVAVGAATANAQTPLGGDYGSLVGGFGSATASDFNSRQFGARQPGAYIGTTTLDTPLGFSIDVPGGGSFNPFSSASVCSSGYVYLTPIEQNQGCVFNPTLGFTNGRLQNNGALLAPFLGLVDTRTTGGVYVGTGTYDGRTSWAASWIGVASGPDYPVTGDNTRQGNFFQVILSDASAVRGAGAFDVTYNYGFVNWLTNLGTTSDAGTTTIGQGYLDQDAQTGGYVQEYVGSRASSSYLLNVAGPAARGGACVGLYGCRYTSSITNAAFDATTVTGVQIYATPEPGTVALVAAGMGVLFGVNTCRRRGARVSA